jgi:indole-3-glycerol phosphate synthase
MAKDAPPTRALVRQGFDLIAEIKLRSPSEGALSVNTDPLQRVRTQAVAYAAGGAAALSVLTEPARFGGSLEHLSCAADAVALPVMRKDFLVDPYQVLEARAAGASGVLLILRLLDDTTLAACVEMARDWDMFVLIEAFDGAELDRARRFLGAAMDPRGVILLGLNSRCLKTLAVQPARLLQLAGRFPAGSVAVAESGIATASDAARVATAGYDLALVGSALMRATDPRHAVKSLVQAGRQAKEHACASV